MSKTKEELAACRRKYNMNPKAVKARQEYDLAYTKAIKTLNLNACAPEDAAKIIANRLRRLVSTSKVRAKKRGILHTLVPQDLINIYYKQEGKCALTGRQLILAKNARDTISLDRIDNTGYYTPDNVQLITWQANVAKNEWNTADLLEFCQVVISKNVVKKQH